MLWGRAKFSLVGLGTCPVWLLRGNASEVLSFGLFFLYVWSPACGYFWADTNGTCVREAMHGVGASVKFSCATLDILLVLSYARNPKRRERENLLSSLTAPLFLLFLYSGSSLMRLSNGCLPSASRLACQMCQNSSVRSLLRESAGCSPFSFPILIPFGISIRCPTCLPHLSLVFF